MLGAIAGDIIGSVYEAKNIKTVDFPLFSAGSRFTDDTVLTVATAEAILDGRDFREAYQDYYHRYPQAGFGGEFAAWASARKKEPYNSWGNGAAMRVSPIGWAFDGLDEVLARARDSAMVSHNHPEGVKGAQAVAAAIFLARTGTGKEELAGFISGTFGYDLSEPLDSVRSWYRFDASCQGSVPQAIRAFLESCDFTSAVRLAISIGGDSDTLACMAGGIAEAFYRQIPKEVIKAVYWLLPEDLAEVVNRFRRQYL